MAGIAARLLVTEVPAAHPATAVRMADLPTAEAAGRLVVAGAGDTPTVAEAVDILAEAAEEDTPAEAAEDTPAVAATLAVGIANSRDTASNQVESPNKCCN